MIRVLAGATAISVVLSFWLLAFCIFLFVSLAYLKRYIETGKAENSDDKILGRGYVGGDAEAMFILGTASATASIVVLALFINSADVQAEYPGRNLLWALCLIMMFWTNRIWISARRGIVHEDPVESAVGQVGKGPGQEVVEHLLAIEILPHCRRSARGAQRLRRS